MALAVDFIDRYGPSNEIHRQLQLKKAKGNAVLAVYTYNSKRRFTRSSLLKRRSALVLKVGVSYGLKTMKCVVSYSQRRGR